MARAMATLQQSIDQRMAALHPSSAKPIPGTSAEQQTANPQQAAGFNAPVTQSTAEVLLRDEKHDSETSEFEDGEISEGEGEV